VWALEPRGTHDMWYMLARHLHLQIRVFGEAKLHLVILQLSGQRAAIGADAEVRSHGVLLSVCLGLSPAERRSSATIHRPALGHGGVHVVQPKSAGAFVQGHHSSALTKRLPVGANPIRDGEKETNTRRRCFRAKTDLIRFTCSDTRWHVPPPK